MARLCVMCDQWLPEDWFAGEVCESCAETYDQWGVYFCLH